MNSGALRWEHIVRWQRSDEHFSAILHKAFADKERWFSELACMQHVSLQG